MSDKAQLGWGWVQRTWKNQGEETEFSEDKNFVQYLELGKYLVQEVLWNQLKLFETKYNVPVTYVAGIMKYLHVNSFNGHNCLRWVLLPSFYRQRKWRQRFK